MLKKIITLFATLVLTSNLMAESINSLSYVSVDFTEPVYKNIKIKTPIKDCYEIEKQIPYECGNSNVNKNSLGIDTLIGATAGVVIGHQIGKGNGKTAAKIIGGIGGAAVANNMRGSSETCYKMGYEEKCETSYSYEYEKELIGYNNYATYEGKQIKKFSKSKLDRIKLRINISY